jgi:hypothetical protein
MPRYDPLKWLEERGVLKTTFLSQFNLSAWRVGFYIIRCWCCFFFGLVVFGTSNAPQNMIGLVSGYEILRRAPYKRVVESSLKLATRIVRLCSYILVSYLFLS